MKKLVIVTLALVIVVLLWRNVEAFSRVVKSFTGLFSESFEAVTEVGDFK